jgi:exonuclease VII small subunit
MKKNNALADAQVALETSTADLKRAQANYLAACKRLAEAEERHVASIVSLNQEVSALRGRCRVSPIGA